MEESELLKPGWGQTIFSEATNLLKIQMQKEAEKQMAEESAKMARAAKEADEDADYEDIKDSPVELDDTARLKLAEELIQEEEAEKKKQAQNANRKGSGGGKKKK